MLSYQYMYDVITSSLYRFNLEKNVYQSFDWAYRSWVISAYSFLYAYGLKSSLDVVPVSQRQAALILLGYKWQYVRDSYMDILK